MCLLIKTLFKKGAYLKRLKTFLKLSNKESLDNLLQSLSSCKIKVIKTLFLQSLKKNF